MSPLRARTTGYKPDGTLPLINIVLLLVLAFMMAGTFTEPMLSDFDPLRSENAQTAEEAMQLVVLTMDVEGVVSQEGLALDAGALEGLLSSLGQGDGVLEVRADARSPAVQVIALLRSAESVGIKDVHIVTLGRK